MAIQTPDWDFQQPQYLAALRNFISLKDPRAQILLTAASGNRFKLQVYTLGLPDVVGPNGLSAASPSAWRYLAHANGKTIAVETAFNTPRITTLIEDPEASQAFHPLVALRRNNLFQDPGLVHLRIGGARVEAYWLRSGPSGTMGTADQVAPFSAPQKSPLKSQPGTPPIIWAPTDLMNALKTAAQKHLDFYGSGSDLNAR